MVRLISRDLRPRKMQLQSTVSSCAVISMDRFLESQFPSSQTIWHMRRFSQLPKPQHFLCPGSTKFYQCTSKPRSVLRSSPFCPIYGFQPKFEIKCPKSDDQAHCQTLSHHIRVYIYSEAPALLPMRRPEQNSTCSRYASGMAGYGKTALSDTTSVKSTSDQKTTYR